MSKPVMQLVFTEQDSDWLRWKKWNSGAPLRDDGPLFFPPFVFQDPDCMASWSEMT